MVNNLTRQTIVSEKVRVAKSLEDHALGMILDKNSQGLILTTRFGIHTFFMKSKIDVLILDKQSRVVKLKKSLNPNRIFLWNPKFDKVIELPVGSINKSKTKLGDDLKFW